MERLLMFLASSWCQIRLLILYFESNPNDYRGWYEYDVVNLKKVYKNSRLYEVQSNYKKWFSYKLSYVNDYYEKVREIKFFNYLITISYYKEQGFHKDLGLEKPLSCDNVVQLSDYQQDIYTYDLLISLIERQKTGTGGETE